MNDYEMRRRERGDEPSNDFPWSLTWVVLWGAVTVFIIHSSTGGIQMKHDTIQKITSKVTLGGVDKDSDLYISLLRKRIRFAEQIKRHHTQKAEKAEDFIEKQTDLIEGRGE